MIRENLLYRIMSYIHITFFASICFAITVTLSGTLLLLPALTAVFKMGQDVLCKKTDITDSVIKTFFSYLKDSVKQMRFVAVDLIMLLNIISLYMFAGSSEHIGFGIATLAVAAMLLIFQFYIAGYYVFVDENFKLMDAAFAMLTRPMFMIPLFAVMVLLLFYLNRIVAIVMLFTGAFGVFIIEVPIFIQMLLFRKMCGKINEDDEFYYLIKRYGRGDKKV